jgi:hypothetical protein
MKHSLIVVTVLAAGLSQLGCIAWQGGTARKIDPFPTAVMQRETPASIAIDVKFSVVALSPPPAALAKAAAGLRGKAMSVAVRSRRFVPSRMPQTADYHLTLQIRDEGSPNIPLAYLSGLTLTVLPAWASDDYDIVATLQDRTGQVVGTYHLQQSQTVFIQLLMIFGMPFASPASASERLWNQVFEDVFTFCDEQIRRRGAAPPPGPPTAEGSARGRCQSHIQSEGGASHIFRSGKETGRAAGRDQKNVGTQRWRWRAGGVPDTYSETRQMGPVKRRMQTPSGDGRLSRPNGRGRMLGGSQLFPVVADHLACDVHPASFLHKASSRWSVWSERSSFCAGAG